MSNYNFSLTLQAEQDIKDIWFHIARDNITAADNVIESFEQAFFKLTTNPNIGSNT
ncbi:MAG TPA: type II toxin-antitoxin system RelE/ParE family toxin [Rickettsia endosymbiont of Columbicola hoogstraali]|nr:type II toxin-antitoxin system RelE/ParE family toxin [Rickettsia endosymbiont of Columbicola hoogstraali]